MSLADLLTNQCEQLQALLDHLQDEQALLLHATPEGEQLSALAEAKAGLLQALQTLDQKRHTLLEALGYTADTAGTEQAALDQHCLQQWQAARDLARQAAHLNQLNGTLIHQRLRHNQGVLDDLWQLTGKPLYGADGQARPGNSRLQSSA